MQKPSQPNETSLHIPNAIIHSLRANDSIIDIRRKLHTCPELGYNENQTGLIISKYLELWGMTVDKNIAKTGLVTTITGKHPGPTICYRTDIDALPINEQNLHPWRSQNEGCMHACGHDAHMAIALDICRKLQKMRDMLHGNIVVLFQPNEEGAPGDSPTGALAVVQSAFLERYDIDACVALHVDPTRNVGEIASCPNTLWAASSRFKFEILGSSGHAAYPSHTRDALEAAARFVTNSYSRLARRRDGRFREITSFTQLIAGESFNVIADKASLEGIIRAESHENINDIFQELNKGLSLFNNEGFKTSSELHLGAPPVENHPTLFAIAQRALSCLNDPQFSLKLAEMQMASEDFAYYSQRRPSLFCLLGTGSSKSTRYPVHHPLFDIDENALEHGTTAMLAIIEQISSTWHHHMV